jgi:hypothetical protein
MGGALSNFTGNKQSLAEANFFNDAIAARMVLRAGFVPPVVLVPLDTTHTTSFRKELADALQTSGPVGRCHLLYLDLSCHLTTEQICGCLAQVLIGVLHEEWRQKRTGAITMVPAVIIPSVSMSTTSGSLLKSDGSIS